MVLIQDGCSNDFLSILCKSNAGWWSWCSTKNFFIVKIPYTLSNLGKIWQITWINRNRKAPKLCWNTKSNTTEESPKFTMYMFTKRFKVPIFHKRKCSIKEINRIANINIFIFLTINWTTSFSISIENYFNFNEYVTACLHWLHA